MNPIFIIILLCLVIFFLATAIFVILKMGGATFRQYIKSKLPGQKQKGAWFIQSGINRKVKLIYKKIPDDLRIKIKSGAIPEDDQYAAIHEIFHQTEGDGVPVLFTLEDLPFTFFLKKHHLENFFEDVDEMIDLIDSIVYKKMYTEADNLKIIIKNKLNDMRNELKYIPPAMYEVEKIFAVEQNREFKDKHSIVLLLEYRKYLLKLKEKLLDSNKQMVNVHDLFQITGFAKNLTKIAFMEWQNGFLAAKQTYLDKKLNLWVVLLMVVVVILSIVSIVMVNGTNKKLQETQVNFLITQKALDDIKQSLGINIEEDLNFYTPNEIPEPYNPLR